MFEFSGMDKLHAVYRKPLNLRSTCLLLWIAAVALQSMWWFQEQDIIPMVLVMVGGAIGINVFLRRNILCRYPISASMMLGFTTYYFLLPPIATLLDGKPLTNNLDHPVLVFVHIFLCFMLLTGTHVIYRHWSLLQNLRWFFADRIYKPLGFFRAPSNLHLLAMGGVGIIATFLQVFVGGGVQQELLGVGNKFMQALFVLAYLPFVMLVRSAMGDNTRISRKWLFIIAGYTILLLVLSMSRNSRTVFLLGLASIGLVYVYGLYIGLYRARDIGAKKLVLGVVCVAIVLGPLADLSTSMVIARGERSELPAVELIQRTMDIYPDKEAIKERRRAALDDNPDWDERYVDNQFMSRLANLKFADSSIDLALAMSNSDRDYFRDIELQRSISIFPRPLLHGLGLNVDKDFVTASSSADMMLYMVTGNSYLLGAFRAGSIIGSGYALFGWGYLFVLAMLSLFLFALADSTTSRTAVARRGLNRTGWLPILSPMAIVGFFTWFSYFSSAARGVDSFSKLTDYFLRGWLEVLLVYTFAYWATYFVSSRSERIRR